MVDFSQLPGELNITMVGGDQLQLPCDFNVNISGYTITNSIFVKSVLAAGGGGAATTVGSTVTSFDVSVTDAAAGTILLDLPENKSSLLSPAIAYRWYLRWVDTSGLTRTILSGNLTSVTP